ncbi:hypothetical protein Ari01nite_24930 [Paractinoplanes rishiriensis]|uniref:Uncharacterized protein n=1 Tax=Paractinoplanes rishiriensis TaxID=1050105 RepID=A0A919JXR2_9ACTN|nr:hypothetical protein Ari01nite_24930 [Actinoplanes rishiriensis]
MDTVMPDRVAAGAPAGTGARDAGAAVVDASGVGLGGESADTDTDTDTGAEGVAGSLACGSGEIGSSGSGVGDGSPASPADVGAVPGIGGLEGCAPSAGPARAKPAVRPTSRTASHDAAETGTGRPLTAVAAPLAPGDTGPG